MKRSPIRYLSLLLLLFTFIISTPIQGTPYQLEPNEILISFVNPGLYTMSASSVGCGLVKRFEDLQLEVWCVPDTLVVEGNTFVGTEEIANHLNSYSGIVRFAEPNGRPELHWEPNDPLYSELWGHQQISMPIAWDVQQGNDEIIIAILDSGIDWNHPDLHDNIYQNLGEDADGDGTIWEYTGTGWIFDPGDVNGIDDDGNGYIDDFAGYDFFNRDNRPEDLCGHGTHIAGIVGALADNDLGVAGVCPNIKLLPIKAFEYHPLVDDCVGANMSQIVEAIAYADSIGARISNLSWGSDYHYESLEEVINHFALSDHCFVTSAGNENKDTDEEETFPACYDLDHIISVAASNQQDQPSQFGAGMGTNLGQTSVDLAAPGSAVLSCWKGGTYDVKQGTSMAAPHVTAAAALIRSQCPDYTAVDIKNLLMATVDTLNSFDGHCKSGGRLNVGAAISAIATECITFQPPCLQRDSLALLALYEATDGANWTNTWALDQPVSTWYGVTLDTEGCSVVCLDLDGNPDCQIGSLSGNNLVGFVPEEIGDLIELRYLNLSFNDLSGPLPDSIGKLVKLESLNLASNSLGGVLPPSIGDMIQLKEIYLYDNNFGGQIPAQLGLLENLEYLNLNANILNNLIPAELGQLSNLVYLFLDDNGLMGQLPSELGNLHNLQTISCSNNSLTGTIPANFGNMLSLNSLDLSDNYLEGCYPTSLCWLDLDLGLGNFNCENNPDLPQSGSTDGFAAFCNGTANDCESGDDCPSLGNIGDACTDENPDTIHDEVQADCTCVGIPADCPELNIDLGPNLFLACEDTIQLSIEVENAALIIWDYEGDIFASDQTSVEVFYPGSYIVVVEDICGNIDVSQVDLVQAEDCVWPGDTNADAIVNTLDLLTFGYNYGTADLARAQQGIVWQGYNAEAWQSTSPDGTNVKHSDANGDGLVDDLDLLAIESNYNNEHGASITIYPTTTEASLKSETDWYASSLTDGYLEIDIDIQTTVDGLHGLAWQIDLSELGVRNATFIYDSEWFGQQESEVRTFSRFDSTKQQIDIGITRIDGQGLSGSGGLGTLVLIEDNVGSWSELGTELYFHVRDAHIMEDDGSINQLPGGFELASTNIYGDKILLREGWNLVSVMTAIHDPSILSVFASLQPDNLLQVVAYENEALLFDAMSEPEANTMNLVEQGKAYWVRVAQDDLWYVDGQRLDSINVNTLNLGWNLAAYSPTHSYTPEIFFEDLLQNGSLRKITGYDQGFLHFEPDLLETNTLLELQPGSGYWIKVDSAQGGLSDPNTNTTNKFDFVRGYTNLAAGQSIGIRDESGNHLGNIVVLENGILESTAVYGDDASTEAVQEGLAAGDQVIFHYNGESINGGISFDGFYVVHVVDLDFTNTSTPKHKEFKLHSYPNPCSDDFFIRLPESYLGESLQLEIYDIRGKLVLDLSNLEAYEGTSGCQINTLTLGPGKYFYRLSSDRESWTDSFHVIR